MPEKLLLVLLFSFALVLDVLGQPVPGTGRSGPAGSGPVAAGVPAAFDLALVARSGDEPPGRPGEVFTFFGDPSLNGVGQVVFKGNFDGPLSGNEGVYRFDPGVPGLARVVDDSFDFSPPGQSGASSWTGFGPPVLQDGGAVLFWGTFSFGDNSQGLYVFGASAGVIFDDNPLQAVPGQPAAIGFTTFPFSAGITPAQADSGHGASVATWFDAGFVQHSGLYVGDVVGGIRRVADDTLTPPGQPGAASFSVLEPGLAMNAQGDVGFRAQVTGGIGGHGVYRFDGPAGVLRRVADGRSTVPGHAGTSFTSMSGAVSMNDAGQVAFRALHSAGPGAEGLYLGDGVGALAVVVDDSGAFPVPDHATKAFASFGAPVVNGAGDVAFFGDFGIASADVGLFLASGGGLQRVLDFGDPVPGQPGAHFIGLGNVALNEQGHLAFTARYSGGSGNEGLYFHDGSQLSRVVDESDTSLGETLTNLHMMIFTGGSGGQDGRPRTLNDADTIAFRATLAGADEGIVVASRQALSLPMVTIPAADVQPGGPGYDFEMGLYEVTNAQLAAFLNDAELHNEIQNPGFGDERGDNMLFRPAPFDIGDVGLVVGDPDTMFDISRSLLTYASGNPVGSRYGVVAGKQQHPAMGMSWIGAAKCCNWLTIDHGLGLAERCYAEGPTEPDWFPVTIGSEIGGTQQATYTVRDLNLTERAALVTGLRGYRLPMDQGGTAVGSVNAVPRPYNEWYKAAAWDPAAPDVPRVAFAGSFEEHTVPPDHWIHGYGRDPLLNADANYRDSGDPFDDPNPAVIATTPVGYYDGTLQGGVFATNPNQNRYGLFDVSGNAWELLNDQVTLTQSLTPDRALVGGSYRSNVRQVPCANRGDIGPDVTRPVVGFRLARVVVPPDPAAPWSDLGNGLAGTPGVPALTGSGTLLAGAPVVLTLSGALPNTSAALVIGLAAVSAPFKGGVMVPRADFLILGLSTGPGGQIPLASSWPQGVPASLSVVFQYWITDPGGPVGFAASNAIQGVTP